MYMGKEGIKHFPLNRYVVQRDGNGNVVEIVTKELIDRKLVDGMKPIPEPKPNSPGDDGDKMTGFEDDVEVYTHVKLEGGQWKWYQQVFGKTIPDSRGSRFLRTTPLGSFCDSIL